MLHDYKIIAEVEYAGYDLQPCVQGLQRQDVLSHICQGYSKNLNESFLISGLEFPPPQAYINLMKPLKS